MCTDAHPVWPTGKISVRYKIRLTASYPRRGLTLYLAAVLSIVASAATAQEGWLLSEPTTWGTTTPACPPPAKSAVPDYPTVRVTGFFQADAVWFAQEPANMVAVGDGDPVDGDAQDGADFRRARLAASGQAWDNVLYMFEMDFAFPGHPSFMDVWLQIEDVCGGNDLRIGQYRQPFGMDGLTSVKELTFLERGLPFTFLPFRQIGAMMFGQSADENLTWAASTFRFPTDVYGGNVGDNGGYGFATRGTALLIDRPDDGGIWHIGGGYSFIDPSNDLIQYRNQPEVFVGETGGGVPADVPGVVPPFVNTGEIPADYASLLNAELGLSLGSLHIQSEAVAATLDQQAGPSLFFSGAYAQAGYLLTGERRPYNHAGGVFGGITPLKSVGKQGGIGAWEIAARWSYIDLNDENIAGGRLNNLTYGLNWYLNPMTKFQANYIHSVLDTRAYGESDADIFALRAQVAF